MDDFLLDLSIVVVNCDTKKLLLNCLESIYSNTAHLNFEIYVIDNNSQDGSAGALRERFPQAKVVINEENLGFAKAVNIALKRCRGRYVLLLNPDIILLPQAIENMVIFLESHPEAGACGPKLLNRDGSLQRSCSYFPTLIRQFFHLTGLKRFIPGKIISRYSLSVDRYEQVLEVDWMISACFMIKQEVIERVGLLDEHFFTEGEDLDICYRIKKDGLRIYLLPAACAIHLCDHGDKREWYRARMALVQRGLFYFFSKYYGWALAYLLRILQISVVSIRMLGWLIVLLLNRERFAQAREKIHIYRLCLFRPSEFSLGRINVLELITALGIGGAEKLLVDMVGRLDPQKYRVMVCYLKNEGLWVPEIEEKGIKIISMNMGSRFNLFVIFKLIWLMKRERIDIVHTHLSRADILGALAAKLAGVAVVISTRHSIFEAGERCYLGRKAYAMAARFMDKIITVSEAVRFHLIKQDGVKANKVIVIHNGIDVYKYRVGCDGSRIRESLGIDENIPLVGIVSRLVPHKGLRYFLEAAARMKRSTPNVKFLIVGETMYYNKEYKRELIRYAQELGLDQEVIFTGARKDISQIMSALDIFVLPSLWDGLGIVILEAQASGKPVIATNVGGIPEIVKNNETGVLISPGDSDKLARAIIALLQDKERMQRMGLAGRDRVERYFSLDMVIERTEALYDELIKEKLNRGI